MAATAEWYEDNGAATGSPQKGTTRTRVGGDNTRSDYGSIDSPNVSRASARIVAGENSFTKYRFVKFSGSFNEVSNCKIAHTEGAMPTGTKLMGQVTSTYATPSRGAMSGTDISNITAVANGTPMQLSSTGPEGTPSAKVSFEGYTQYFVSQVQTQASAAAGDIGDKKITIQWNEN